MIEPRTFLRRLRALALPAAFASLTLPAPACAAPVFGLAGGATQFGQTLSVTAQALDLIDLYGYQLTLRFDPSQVQALGVSEGPFLGAGGTTFFDGGTIDNVGGTISFVFDTLIGPGAGVDGSGDLATFRFATLAGGTVAFALEDVAAVDSALDPIAVTTRALGLVVPEPGGLPLVAAGLLACAIATRRRPVVARTEGAR